MEYITYETMCRDIRQNLTKIPRDVCGVLGIPRSGMLPATIIAEHLNIGLCTLDAAMSMGVDAALRSHGGRSLRKTSSRRLLVVDDSCYYGNALTSVRDTLSHPAFSGYDITVLVVYLEGPCTKERPDIWLRDIRSTAADGPFGWAIYEWNLFAHGRLTERTLFDLDGVICVEPPDERYTDAYETYIAKPTPLHVPTAKTVSICTYRLMRYAGVTAKSLADMGLPDVNLHMATDRKLPPADFKAQVYRGDYWMLFVESSRRQATLLREYTRKPVICMETNELIY